MAEVAGGGGVPSSVPGVPAAPTPGSSPIPLSSGDYATSAAMANAAYNQALASINGQRQNALQSFGYSGQIDPTTGQITNMQVDPNNPYGQLQSLLRQGAADQQGVQAAAAARGLGAVSGARGGGLAAQGLTNAKLAFGANSANLGQSLMSTLGDLSGQQQSAQDTMNNALWQAELASAQNAIQTGAFNPADFSGITDQGIPGSNPSSFAPSSLSGAGKGFQGATAPRPRQRVKDTGGGVARANTFHRAVQTRSRPKRRR